VLDNAILSYEITDKLFNMLRKDSNDGNPTAKATTQLDELIYLLKPLMPHKYYSNIGKFTRLIKIAQALNATDGILANSDEHSTNSEPKRKNPDSSASESENSTAGSFDMIAKLVSLLS